MITLLVYISDYKDTLPKYPSFWSYGDSSYHTHEMFLNNHVALGILYNILENVTTKA